MAEINHCSFFSPTRPSPTLQLSIAPTMPSTSAYEGTLACEELKWTIAADMAGGMKPVWPAWLRFIDRQALTVTFYRQD